jgi:hypothetical protein
MSSARFETILSYENSGQTPRRNRKPNGMDDVGRRAFAAGIAARRRRATESNQGYDAVLAADVRAGDARVMAKVEARRARLTPQPTLVADLVARIRPRSRESRPQGCRVRSSAASRDGPLPPADDDPDLTPLQRAFLLLLEPLCLTSADGPRTFLEFLQAAGARVDAEISRVDDWSER